MHTELNLMGHMSKIMDLSKDTGINAELFEKTKEHIDFITKEMDITPVQAVLFCHVFDTSLLTSHVGRNALYESLKCTKLEYLGYLNELDGLINKNFVIQELDNERTPSYKIPREFILSIRKGKPLKPENYNNLPIERFFSVLGKIFTRCYNDELLPDESLNLLDSLMNNNEQLGFTKKIAEYDLNRIDRGLLLYFCSNEINRDESVDFEHMEKQLFGDDAISYRLLVILLQNERHPLQKLELIERVHIGGLVLNEDFKLTEKAKDELFIELKKEKKKPKDFILSTDITEKQMFYNTPETEKIEKLTALLRQENFSGIVSRLSEKGLRKGFACLFSGSPGTGKTETVYQIARRTGRSIMAVDLSQIKSMWVGESEKQIKKIFDRYKKYTENEDIAPILLFNEADGIIGKRMEFNEESRAVDQMENTMQNIILQEMENLNGILIATTNLTKNMDKAFERRFLYKIEFSKPEAQARQLLWKNMMPEISENDASTLASRFDFSGGQIENIVRKRTVDMVLSGEEPNIETLLSYCSDESLSKEKTVQIGFMAVQS
jgi:hypothetical protein